MAASAFHARFYFPVVVAVIGTGVFVIVDVVVAIIQLRKVLAGL